MTRTKDIYKPSRRKNGEGVGKFCTVNLKEDIATKFKHLVQAYSDIYGQKMTPTQVIKRLMDAGVKRCDPDVYNAMKIALKKKEYPKTYEECCKILNLPIRDLDILDNVLDTTKITYSKNLDRLLNSFRKLRICRDAYWKIAGEDMGLEKPWEPIYQDDKQDKHCIYVDVWGITLRQDNIVQHTFSFPTKEMRDAFKENFDPDIKIYKELL